MLYTWRCAQITQCSIIVWKLSTFRVSSTNKQNRRDTGLSDIVRAQMDRGMGEGTVDGCKKLNTHPPLVRCSRTVRRSSFTPCAPVLRANYGATCLRNARKKERNHTTARQGTEWLSLPPRVRELALGGRSSKHH